MLIHEIRLAGLLSFGPDTPPLPMKRLNILVGPNGSGKSNFIEAIALLRSAATKLTTPIREKGGGGVIEWIWKGKPNGMAAIDATIKLEGEQDLIRHSIEFCAESQRFVLLDERIGKDVTYPSQPDGFYFYRILRGTPLLMIQDRGDQRFLEVKDVAQDESILSQRRDPEHYSQLSNLAQNYERIRIYREWSFGRSPIFRTPQSADLPSDRLEENFSNLGLFLNHLRSIPSVKSVIQSELRNLYSGLDDFDIRVKGGTVEVFLTERNFVIPASRLSDGTLRFLCLLAILCDPNPAPLICIEEPELGMHPDMLPGIADLLVAASERTQLVVTTHSDILIDAMTERPECVVVFDKQDGLTTAQRLNADDLKIWLKDYRLGRLWTDGQIGGVRW